MVFTQNSKLAFPPDTFNFFFRFINLSSWSTLQKLTVTGTALACLLYYNLIPHFLHILSSVYYSHLKILITFTITDIILRCYAAFLAPAHRCVESTFSPGLSRHDLTSLWGFHYLIFFPLFCIMLLLHCANAGFFTRAHSDRTRCNVFNLKEGKFRFNFKKKCFTVRVVNSERGCPEKLWMPHAWYCPKSGWIGL